MSLSSSWTDRILSSVTIGRRPSRSLHRQSSKASSYVSYSVYHQAMGLSIFTDPDATRKMLEYVLDSPGGRRSLSRVARTCKAFCAPALDLLWRELDSLLPLISLFPNHLFKRSRRPGLGLAIMPLEEDWDRILVYGQRVHRLTYDESSKSISPSIFPIIEEYRPRTYILPNLSTLVWRAESPAGLDRSQLFLSPDLQSLVLEIGTRFPQLSTFFTDLSLHTRLTSLAVTSPTSLPENFTFLIHPQEALEHLALHAPGALSPAVGQWAAALPCLRSLQIDLTGRSPIAVEGFFDDIVSGSGYSTPDSPDSGVFSGEDIDFTEIKKSSLRLTEDRLPVKGAFLDLRHLHLTGDVSNVVIFLRHLASPISNLELVIEDPMDKADWRDLCRLLCQYLGDCLQVLRISASNTARFNDLVRTTSRAEVVARRLALDALLYLPHLVRFEIDLPESVVFHNADLSRVADACPNLEILRLCPVARFPIAGGPPALTLEGLAHLTARCRRLHTLAAVVDAQGGSAALFADPRVSSRSLFRLHVGHSWIRDPLAAAILLSHLAPYAESFRWFHEKNRPGFIETHAQNWARAAEILPHLQAVRLVERQAAARGVLDLPVKVHKSVDATVSVRTRGVHAVVETVDSGVQVKPQMASRVIEAKPTLFSTAVDATPAMQSEGIDAVPEVCEMAIDATPALVSQEVSAVVETASRYVDAVISPEPEKSSMRFHIPQLHVPKLYVPPVVTGAVNIAWRAMLFGPNFMTARMHDVWTMTPFHAHKTHAQPENEKVEGNGTEHETEKPKQGGETSGNGISPAEYLHTDTGHDITYDTHESNEIDEPSLATENPPAVLVGAGGEDVTETQTAESGSPNPSVEVPKADAATRQFSIVHIPSPQSELYDFIMSEPRKQEKDFSKEVDEALPKAQALAQSGKLQDALDQLFALEKQSRNASDLKSTTRLATAAPELAYAAGDLDQVNSIIQTLSKKHGQFKDAIRTMVELAMSWLEDIEKKYGTEKWLELVETLRSVTEGKIFLETPRARVTLLLAKYHEKLAKAATTAEAARQALVTACDLLSELQVETYSSMDRREKTEFILEQMRLLIDVARLKDAEVGEDKKDSLGGGEAEWVKVKVGSRKINEDFLKHENNEDLKLKYYDLMVQHGLHHSAYLDVANYYYKVWETPSIQKDETGKGQLALEHVAYYVVLAPHDNEQSDMMHRIFRNPALKRMDVQYNLLKSFTTQELMRWPGIEEVYGPFLRKSPVFADDKHWKDLHSRVIEHNIRVVAAYYTRITLSRLTDLLVLSPQETEETLSRLVVSGSVWARIDRPTGIVSFRNKRSAEDVMNDWSSDMQKLLGLVEKAWMGMNAAQAAQAKAKA